MGHFNVFVLVVSSVCLLRGKTTENVIIPERVRSGYTKRCARKEFFPGTDPAAPHPGSVEPALYRFLDAFTMGHHRSPQPGSSFGISKPCFLSYL